MADELKSRKLRKEDELGKRVGDSPLARLLREVGCEGQHNAKAAQPETKS